MSVLKNFVYDIETSIEEGHMSFAEIAERYNITVEDVNLIAVELDKQYEHESMMYEAMDGDHDSAMASAGFGTDEDYGYYGDEF